MRKLSQRRPRLLQKGAAIVRPLIIHTESLAPPASHWLTWFLVWWRRPPLDDGAWAVHQAGSAIRPSIAPPTSGHPTACFVAYSQSRYMAVMLAGVMSPVNRAVLPDPVSRWYSSQMSKGLLSSDIVLQILRSPRCTTRLALVNCCFLHAQQIIQDTSYAVNILSSLPLPLQQSVLCHHLLSGPSALSQRFPGALGLLRDPSRLQCWTDALNLCTSLPSVEVVWRDHQLAMQLIERLSSSPTHAEQSTRAALNHLISGAPLEHSLNVCKQLCHGSRWLLALSCIPSNSSAEWADELNIRARFEIGDWAAALTVASDAKNDRLKALVIQLLIQREQTVLACVAIQRCERIAKTTPILSAGSTALLLAQLARRKRTQEETQWYRWVIDDMLRLLHKHEYVGNAAVDMAASAALAACGSWERVLGLCTSTSKPPVVMSLLVAAAGGGAPWEVLRQSALTLVKVATPASKLTCEMLVRCALEAGEWRDALGLFARHGNALNVSTAILDHPVLVRHRTALPSVPFSSTSFVYCGRWEDALRVEKESRVVSSLRSAAGRYIASNPHLWSIAMMLAHTTEEKLAVACGMLGTPSQWAVGIAVLLQLIGAERHTTRTFVLHSAARALSTVSPTAAIELLTNSDAECWGSKGRAAWALQTVLKRPSRLTMDAVLPWLSWADAIGCLQAHTERPSTDVFLSSVVSYFEHQWKNTSMIVILRLLSANRGRRRPSERAFTVLFDAQRPRGALNVSAAPRDSRPATVEIEVSPTSVGHSHMWCLAIGLLSKPISTFTKRPWSQLGDCPEDVLLHAVRTLRPSQECTGLCLSGLAARGRWEAGIRMMGALAESKTFPEMESLVDLIESSESVSGDTPLRICVEALRRFTPSAVSNNVLRAVAERSAVERGSTWGGAIEVLAMVALAGVRHIPSSVVQRIAEVAPSKAARVAIQLLDARTSHTTSPIALDAASIRHVVAAAAAASLEPTVDVVVLRGGAFVGAMTSSSRPFSGCSNGVVKHLATTPLPSLWHIALDILANSAVPLSHRNTNRSIVLAALGCGDVTVLERVLPLCPSVRRSSQKLLGPHSALRVTSLNNSSKTLDAQTCAVLSCVLAFKFGKWEHALQMLGGDSLLMRASRVAVTHSTGLFDDSLRDTLTAYRRELLKHRGGLGREIKRMIRSARVVTDCDPLWWLM